MPIPVSTTETRHGTVWKRAGKYFNDGVLTTVLDGIVYEIAQHLPNSAAVRIQRGQVFGDKDADADVQVLGQRFDRFNDLMHQFRQGDKAPRHGELSHFDASDRSEILSQIAESLRVALDLGDKRTAYAHILQCAVQQGVGESTDREYGAS